MAWRQPTIVASMIALVALILYPYNAVVSGAGAAGLLQRFYALAPSQIHVDAQQAKGAAGEDWDLKYHLGGIGPWIPKVDGVVGGGVDPPPGCRVEQVHMGYQDMLELYHRIQAESVTLNGSLAFANAWDFFMPSPGQHLEHLVPTGPYAGTLQAFATGVRLRTRYANLLASALARDHTTMFWASGFKRVEDTAALFGTAFFGLHWRAKGTAALQVIPETADRGGDTLTPGRTCFKYAHNADAQGHAQGERMWHEWRGVYLPPIVARLARENPGMLFSESEVYSMQELCGFEMIAKGGSQWCAVFTEREWEGFEYAWDVLHYYHSGPGNPYSAVMGGLWLDATTGLLKHGPEEAGPLFFSLCVGPPARLTEVGLSSSVVPRTDHQTYSAHDGDLLPILTALGFWPGHNATHPQLPTSHMSADRHFRTSDLVPMSATLILERLACPARERWCEDRAEFGYPNMVYCEPEGREERFVRVVVNEGVVALPGCEGGPGRSCGLEEFLGRVEEEGRSRGGFREVCGLPKDARKGISFLHQ
ncbi:hypothetical protein LTR53_013439 [Teratosphaeriaceae sp. CCFEE 6253]|nr:hypothetical protein LTR53_013439 [Teratosphaeriaceae sp. CCFEE 6253]